MVLPGLVHTTRPIVELQVDWENLCMLLESVPPIVNPQGLWVSRKVCCIMQGLVTVKSRITDLNLTTPSISVGDRTVITFVILVMLHLLRWWWRGFARPSAISAILGLHHRLGFAILLRLRGSGFLLRRFSRVFLCLGWFLFSD